VVVIPVVVGTAVVGASVVVSGRIVGCSMSFGCVTSISIVDSMVAERVDSEPSEASAGCVWVPSSGSSAVGSISEYEPVLSEPIEDVTKSGEVVDDADVKDTEEEELD
jgi:hypothetical protein